MFFLKVALENKINGRVKGNKFFMNVREIFSELIYLFLLVFELWAIEVFDFIKGFWT